MSAMDEKVIVFYRSIFADLRVDLEEAADLTEFFLSINPPPDKLIWLRARAFKNGVEFLSESERSNVSIFRVINFIVHSLEKSLLDPKELANRVPLDFDLYTNFYKSIYEDLTIDQEESAELFAFFLANPPERADLTATRSLAFRVATDYISEDKDANIQLLRAVNVVVYALHQTCYEARTYELQMPLPVQTSLDSMELGEAVQNLWDLDANRLTPNEDYVMDVQSGKKPYYKEDFAPDPLFTSVDRDVWKRPTYAAFRALLDNYRSEVGVSEYETSTERKEVKTFLRALLQTPCMQFCHKYCLAHGKAPESKNAFLRLLCKIWFEMYNRQRGGRPDSSGFEHVFVGEAKDGAVSGFHNWMQFYLEEQAGTVDYRGYIKPRSNGDSNANSNDHLLTLQFNWEGVEKYVGTFFVGVSPEFEMALYTMCFLVGGEENAFELDTGTDVFGLNIKCYQMDGDKIGTAFPEVTSHYEE